MYQIVQLHSWDCLCKISIKINVVTDKGNSQNEIWTMNKRWNWSGWKKLGLSASWTHSLIAQAMSVWMKFRDRALKSHSGQLSRTNILKSFIGEYSLSLSVSLSLSLSVSLSLSLELSKVCSVPSLMYWQQTDFLPLYFTPKFQLLGEKEPLHNILPKPGPCSLQLINLTF